jgi:hypothetical protein
LTKYAPRGRRNQGRPLQRLLEERDWNRPAMDYFPRSEIIIVIIILLFIFTGFLSSLVLLLLSQW